MAAALGESVRLVGSALTGMGIESRSVIPMIRALRAAAHGFIDLELRAGFGLRVDIDDSFTVMVDLVIDAISEEPRSGSRPLESA